MLSNEKCRAILNSGDKKYSDEEVKSIKEFLYKIAIIEYEQGKKHIGGTTSSPLHKGIN
jgi:hypothetical protein